METLDTPALDLGNSDKLDSILESVKKREQELENIKKIKIKIVELEKLQKQVEAKKNEILKLQEKIGI